MMGEGQIVQRLIGAIKDKQSDLAESGMLRPESDIIRSGVQAGRYQGLQLALDFLSDIISDKLEKDSNL